MTQVGGKRMIYSASLTQGPRPSLFSFLLNGRIRITTITVSELLLLGGAAMSTLGKDDDTTSILGSTGGRSIEMNTTSTPQKKEILLQKLGRITLPTQFKLLLPVVYSTDSKLEFRLKE